MMQPEKYHKTSRRNGFLGIPGDRQWGGIALEYILVTTFTLATTLATLGYLKKILKDRFNDLEAAGASSEVDDSIWSP